jgi:hypothetical protein
MKYSHIKHQLKVISKSTLTAFSIPKQSPIFRFVLRSWASELYSPSQSHIIHRMPVNTIRIQHSMHVKMHVSKEEKEQGTASDGEEEKK